MFTGIIETVGIIESAQSEGSNRILTIASPISDELKIDQSVAHNGVCLTVMGRQKGKHQVTLVEETLIRSNLGQMSVGKKLNLERSLSPTARLDGHMVQGHVDTTAFCKHVEERNGSWFYTFHCNDPAIQSMLVDKGSICINGVSLTVVKPEGKEFSVAIIPYTYENTTFKSIKENDLVNLEFDIVGKYIVNYMNNIKASLISEIKSSLEDK